MDPMDDRLRQLRAITEELTIQARLRYSGKAAWIIVALMGVSMLLVWSISVTI